MRSQVAMIREMLGAMAAPDPRRDHEAAAAVTPEGFHTHLCERCGHEWQHTDQLAERPDLVSLERYATAHACPQCQTDQRYRHRIGGMSREERRRLDPEIRAMRAERGIVNADLCSMILMVASVVLMLLAGRCA